MPGWHERTLDLQNSGEIKMVGIIQEQHPDRCKLFMQWKEMDWPIMVDSLNLLDIGVVPIHILIDEHGIVRNMRPRQDDLDKFLETDFPEPDGESTSKPALPDLDDLLAMSGAGVGIFSRRYGDALFLWGEDEEINNVIEVYRKAVDLEPGDGRAHFRLGVAYRKRFESEFRQDGDFANAIEQWRLARETNPNQYIWRRRIQQYGPRLDKPYPFYDWVETARADIKARGGTPVFINTEPSGAEIAQRAREFAVENSAVSNPDPDGKIHQDADGLIISEGIVVPTTDNSDSSIRVHVLFRPNDKLKAHWNNEAEEMMVWIDPPSGWQIDKRLHTIPNSSEALSTELRRVEFELHRNDDTSSASFTFPIFALYNVCEDVDGQCLYRRLNVEISVNQN